MWRGLRTLNKKKHFPLPSILLANAQSLKNKTILCGLYALDRDGYVTAFTESQSDTDSDSTGSIDGLGYLIRLDPNPDVLAKRHGGGVSMSINPKWCDGATGREWICSADIELLSVFVRLLDSSQ